MAVKFEHNCYKITLEDISGRVNDFPFAKVYQCKYGKEKYLTKLYKPVRDLLREFREGAVELDECINKIYSAVDLVKLQYPECFPNRGWYDKKVWRESEGNEAEQEKYLAKLAIVQEKLEVERKEKELKVKREKELKESLYKGILSLGLTTFSVREVKPIAKELGILYLKKYDLEILLDGRIKAVGSKFILI